jgi:hypothetical protein
MANAVSAATQVHSSLLSLSVGAVVLPAAYHFMLDPHAASIEVQRISILQMSHAVSSLFVFVSQLVNYISLGDRFLLYYCSVRPSFFCIRLAYLALITILSLPRIPPIPAVVTHSLIQRSAEKKQQSIGHHTGEQTSSQRLSEKHSSLPNQFPSIAFDGHALS